MKELQLGQKLTYKDTDGTVSFLYATGHIQITFGIFRKVFSNSEFWSEVKSGTITLVD